MMVETIVDKLNLCDSMQRIDSYTQKKWLKIFNFFYILSSNNTLSALIIIIAIFSSRKITSSFQYLSNDDVLYKDIIKLNSNFF